MRSPFMQALESRLSNPSFQRGITEAGLSILANSGPSAQPRNFGQIAAQGALQGMGAYRQEDERQKVLKQQEAQKTAATEAAKSIEDPALKRLAMADPKMARDILMKRMENQITPYQQAQLDQGGRRLDISEEQVGLQEQGVDLQRQGLDLRRSGMGQDEAHRQAKLGLERDKFQHEQESGGAEATKALMTRARKIQDAMRLNGLSEAEATALVDSQTRVVTDPVSGKSLSFNQATGEAEGIETPRQPVEPIRGGGAQPHSIEEMAAQTGLGPTLQDYWARTAGQFDPSIVDPAKAKAMTQHRFVKTQLRSALMNNPRGAVWEQQQIDQLLPEEGVLESPARAAEIYKAAKDAVEMQHDFNVDQINSGSLSGDLEAQFREKNVQLEAIHRMMPEAGGLQEQPSAQPQAQAESAAIDPKIAQASADLGVDQQIVMQAAEEAGVSPADIIARLRAR